MPVEFKDYYRVPDVPPKAADEEIKKTVQRGLNERFRAGDRSRNET